MLNTSFYFDNSGKRYIFALSKRNKNNNNKKGENYEYEIN